MSLQDKIALITGASSGIGRATAVLFAREGAAVALVGRNLDALETVAAEIRKHAANPLILQANVTHADECQRAVSETAAAYGRLDILVNAAGIIGSGSIESTTREAWDRMMRVNLDAVFQMMQLATPYLKQRRGTIVNVSSVTGSRAFPNLVAYCVSKAAVDQLTRCAALDLAADGVRVNAVNPGVVITELHRRAGMQEEAYAKFLEHSKTTHPLGRVGRAEEIAEAILFLASSRSGWVTGVTLNIDGGRHLTCAR